jgi:hypothetical protein
MVVIAAAVYYALYMMLMEIGCGLTAYLTNMPSGLNRFLSLSIRGGVLREPFFLSLTLTIPAEKMMHSIRVFLFIRAPLATNLAIIHATPEQKTPSHAQLRAAKADQGKRLPRSNSDSCRPKLKAQRR